MITPTSFTSEWIMDQCQQRPGLDPSILEKMILALTLVERLIDTGLPFVFKGGTCLVLVLGQARRFSVDVDLVTQAELTAIDTALTQVCTQPPFRSFTFDATRSHKDDVPRGHYYVYYDSALDQELVAEHPQRSIAIDLLFEEHNYPQLLQLPVSSPFLVEEGESRQVAVPSVESITGDKLTAFAPRTTGILYGKGKELEIIKQLFDLGVLFDQVQDVATVAESFAATVAKELRYRHLIEATAADVLVDTLQTALLLAQMKLNRIAAKEPAPVELRRGIIAFRNFVIDGAFREDQAVAAAARVAYLAARLLTRDYSPLPRPEPGTDPRAYFIPHSDFNYLNKLRTVPGDALFYWHHTVTLLHAHEQIAWLG
jgi:Nucleotidyl transferase AbiEii toxin, Type IV TA system